MKDLSAREGRPLCEKNFSSLVLDNRIFMQLLNFKLAPIPVTSTFENENLNTSRLSSGNKLKCPYLLTDVRHRQKRNHGQYFVIAAR